MGLSFHLTFQKMSRCTPFHPRFAGKLMFALEDHTTEGKVLLWTSLSGNHFMKRLVKVKKSMGEDEYELCQVRSFSRNKAERGLLNELLFTNARGMFLYSQRTRALNRG